MFATVTLTVLCLSARARITMFATVALTVLCLSVVLSVVSFYTWGLLASMDSHSADCAWKHKYPTRMRTAICFK